MFLNKNIILLLLGQGFSGAVVSLLTFSSGLAGKWLLDGILYAKACLHCYNSSFASLPISATLCGAFIAVFFSSNLMQKFGRKKVFLYASLIGCLGAGFAMFSLVSGLFYLFCFATFLLGFFTALNQFYRFLANLFTLSFNPNKSFLIFEKSPLTNSLFLTTIFPSTITVCTFEGFEE